MMSLRRLFTPMAVVTAFAAAALGLAVPVRAAAGCQADVRAHFRGDEIRDEIVVKTFLVEVTSSEKCAKVSFDLITTEHRFDGKEITSTRREWQKVTAEPSTARVVQYRMPRDSSLVKWELKLTRCAVCGTE